MPLPATQLKTGMVIRHGGGIQRIVELNHVTPGKGRGMVHAKLRNVQSGVASEYRFRSDERADNVSLDQKAMQFLYRAGDDLCFMNTADYEQMHIAADLLGDKVVYLEEGMEIPMTVLLEITETAPPLKGATASGSLKPATLSNGTTVKVPDYMKTGDTVKVDTRDGSFIERVT